MWEQYVMIEEESEETIVEEMEEEMEEALLLGVE